MKINRCEYNPIININDVVPSDSRFKVIGVFNAGVTEYNGEILLLLRVAEKSIDNEKEYRVPVYNVQNKRYDILSFDKNDRTYDYNDPRVIRKEEKVWLTSVSQLRIARSSDYVHFKIENKPFIIGDNELEIYGVEDPRITKIGRKYYINYSGVSDHGICTMLAETEDFITVKKLGAIFLPDNKDAVIFPKKINGVYFALNRPVSEYFKKPEIWISRSKDLKNFGSHKIFMSLSVKGFDDLRIGGSCVPFLIKEGWLVIYHGCGKDLKYSLGAALLDKNDPARILKRSRSAIMEPEASYEKNGFVPNVIFSCGCIRKGNTVHLYYGACDENLCYAKFQIKDILEELEDA